MGTIQARGTKVSEKEVIPTFCCVLSGGEIMLWKDCYCNRESASHVLKRPRPMISRSHLHLYFSLYQALDIQLFFLVFQTRNNVVHFFFEDTF